MIAPTLNTDGFSSATDEALMGAITDRNENALAALYQRHGETLRSIIESVIHEQAEAEDVLQEGFLKVFRHLHQYKFQGELGGWIRQIMVNTAINYLKKNSRYQLELSFTDSSLHPVSVDDPEASLSVKELAELIRQLPPGYQTIFNLHAVEGYTHVEIGKILGINEGTSRFQYARARTLLISWINKNSTDAKTESYARP